MGDFDYGYERGWWGADGIPEWDGDEENIDTRNNSKKRLSPYNFNMDWFGAYPIRIYVDLTPKNFLDKKQVEIRELLEEKDSTIKLKIKVNSSNRYDSKALEVYYDDIFIGFVRKKYKDWEYDHSDTIDSYVFDQEKLDNIQIKWKNKKYILSKPDTIINEKILNNVSIKLSNDEKWIKNIWEWSIKYRLDTIPLDKDELKKLTYLGTSKSNKKRLKVNSLPKEIFKLTQVEALAFENNNITYLADEISKLKNLKYIFMAGNQLKVLPESIIKLKQLEFIDLSRNEFKIFPTMICGLVSLKELYISENKLVNIPLEIERLINLEELDFGENDLVELPKEIGNLSKLKTLTLWDNKLKKLPDEIGNLITLEELFLSDNNLRSLPQTMEKLTNFTLSPYLHNNPVELKMPRKKWGWFW